ncbi:MAG TPA: SPOR domain-containing protein [Arenibaculum sp.]|nr:SPOR domain-containing protein [Arenibaculum sp.]
MTTTQDELPLQPPASRRRRAVPPHGPEKGRRVVRVLLTVAGLTGTFAVGAWLSATLVEPPAPPPPLVVTPTVAPASVEPEPELAEPDGHRAETDHPAAVPDLHFPDVAVMEPEGPAIDPAALDPAGMPEQEPAIRAPDATVPADPVSGDGAPVEPAPAGDAAAEDEAAPPAPVTAVAAPEPPPAETLPAETPPAGTPAAKPAPAGPERFTVQVGTFSVPENAERLASTLNGLGFDVYTLDWTDRAGASWRVVRVGRLANEAEAGRVLSELRERASQRGDVIRLR